MVVLSFQGSVFQGRLGSRSSSVGALKIRIEYRVSGPLYSIDILRKVIRNSIR